LISLTNKDHWLIDRVKLSGEDKALIFNDKEITFIELQKLSFQAANYFRISGIKKNNHIAIFSENNLEFIISIFALWLIEAVPIPLNIRSTNDEIKSFVEISHSKFLINICGIFSNRTIPNLEIINLNLQKIEKQEKHFKPSVFNSTNIALMLFTSGSSGIPKCVPLTFDNLYYSGKSADEFIKHRKQDLWLASLPFYHIGGFSIITRTLLSGCSLVIPKSTKINNIKDIIGKYSPSLLSLVPVMLKKLMEEDIRPWQKLKIMFLGGGPTPEQLINQAIKNMFPVALVYGSTETSSMVTFCSFENLIHNGISAGKPFNDVDVKIIINKELANKEKSIGRISVKSKSVAKAYFNSKLNENKENLNNGKFITNDLGYFDKNGNLNIIGRRDEIIISGGENISLLEIKNLLNTKFFNNDFEILGVQDKKWGQSYIVIVEKTDQEIEKEISLFLQTKLASYKLPQNIYSIEKIPRNEMGKVQKEKLKKLIDVDFL
jgi:O-succinylbenzoic acid--CoA ligase